jgi:hypothetical protein
MAGINAGRGFNAPAIWRFNSIRRFGGRRLTCARPFHARISSKQQEKLMQLKINWSQPSTWRGLAMLVSGVIVGGLTLFGYADEASQANGILQTLIGLMSGGMTTSGLIGVLSDDAKP